jgi:hypothetical protein
MNSADNRRELALGGGKYVSLLNTDRRQEAEKRRTTATARCSLSVIAGARGSSTVFSTVTGMSVGVPSARSASAAARPSRGRSCGCLDSMRPISTSSAAGAPGSL